MWKCYIILVIAFLCYLLLCDLAKWSSWCTARKYARLEGVVRRWGIIAHQFWYARNHQAFILMQFSEFMMHCGRPTLACLKTCLLVILCVHVDFYLWHWLLQRWFKNFLGEWNIGLVSVGASHGYFKCRFDIIVDGWMRFVLIVLKLAGKYPSD